MKKNIAKNQHYVYRYYLEAWKIDNKNSLWCFSNGKIFESNPTNLGVKKYFNKFPELSKNDINIASKIVYNLYKKDSNFKHIVREILEKYAHNANLIYDSVIYLNFLEYLNLKTDKPTAQTINNQKTLISDFINHGFEDRYTEIESTNKYIINQLRKGEINFWEEHKSKVNFIHYLLNQYFRTKKMRDNIIKMLESYLDAFIKLGEIDSEDVLNLNGISQIITDIMEAALYYDGIFIHKSLFLLINNTDIPFITSDQPVNNISPFNRDTNQFDEFILYYPISPKYSILIENETDTTKERYLGTMDVEYYNHLIVQHSHNQIYSNDYNVLLNITKLL